jgi:DNA-directed RNA polymerase subunit RPC12/RpoP
MEMVDIENYENENGEINWVEYNKAKIENGDECYTCGTQIFFSKGCRQQCSQCDNIKKDKKLSHDKFVRCPKCRKTWNPMGSEDWELFQEGDHGIWCNDCGHEFEIYVIVKYTFKSPKLLEKNNES